MRPGGPFFPLQTSSICIGSDLCYLFFPSLPFLIFCSLPTLAISSFPISFNYKINQLSELISEFQLVLLTAGSFRNTSSSAYSKPNSSSFLHLHPNLTSCWWDGVMSWKEHKVGKWEDMDSTPDTRAVNWGHHPTKSPKWVGWWRHIPSTLYSFRFANPTSITLPGTRGWKLSVNFHPHINSVLKWKGDFSDN